MSLVSDFISWASGVFYTNNRRLITGANANTMAQKIANIFVTKDEPVPSYVIAVQQTDLDINNQIIITHGLGTIVPGVIIYDENDYIAGPSLCKVNPITKNTVQLTFYDDIPLTGNGTYRFDFFYIVDDIELPYVPSEDEIFKEDFSSWTGEGYEAIPASWTFELFISNQYGQTIDRNENYYFENIDNALHIHAASQSLFNAIPPFTVKSKKYKLKVTVISGKLKIIIAGINNYIFSVPGTYVKEFQALSTSSKIYFYANSGTDVVIDDLLIYPISD